MSKQTKANLVLVLLTMSWGLSYILTEISFRELAPFTINFYRFLIAFIGIFILQFKKLYPIDKNVLKQSLILGFLLFCTYFCATFGQLHTTVTNAAFLSCLTGLFVPLISFFAYGTKFTKSTYLITFFTILGIGLMTVDENFSIANRYLLGNIISLFTSFFYALHIMVSERSIKKMEVNPLQLGVYQMLFCCIFNWIAALFFEKMTLPSQPAVTYSILAAAIICTAFPFITQPYALKHTTSFHAGIIFTLEPLFATLLASILFKDRMTNQAKLGALILILSLLLMELGPTIGDKLKRDGKKPSL